MLTSCRALLVLTITAGMASAACTGDEAQTGTETPAVRATASVDATATTSAAAPGRSCADSATPPVFCADTAGMETARVVKIIDGDTLDVTLDGRGERVRIFGIDTPERGDRCWAEASALLEALAGTELRLQADARKVDRNGRLLRYVYQPGGLSIDAAMIAAGAAYAWTRDGALRDELIAVEAEARLNRVGCLWAG